MAKFAYGFSRGNGSSIPSSKGLEVGLDLYTGSTYAQTLFADYASVYSTGSSNATGLSNSPRASYFHQLTESIHQLAALPEFDPMHIDAETKAYAVDLVGLIRDQFDIEAPQFFPQDAEALVLTWDKGRVKRLLTIAGEEVSLLDLDRATQKRAYHDVNDGHHAMGELIALLSRGSNVRSTVLED